MDSMEHIQSDNELDSDFEEDEDEVENEEVDEEDKGQISASCCFYCILSMVRSPLLGVCIRVVSQPFCVDQLNPAGFISVRATLPIYLIDQVFSLQRRAERRNGKFKKIMKTRNILIFIR